ncbi:MAG: SLC5 family protein, partial [Pontixanthobacter sp.]
MNGSIQIAVFVAITALIALATWLHCRNRGKGQAADEKDYFLANGGLAWYFVAGSITLTNLS